MSSLALLMAKLPAVGGGGLVVTNPIAAWSRTSGSGAVTSASFAVTAGDYLVVGAGGDGGGDPMTVTNSGTGFTWTQRATDNTHGRTAIHTAPVSTSQTITLTRAASSEKWFGYVWVVSGQHASPIGVASAGNSTSNSITPAYTASAAGSILFCIASEWLETGPPVTTGWTATQHIDLSGYTEGFAARKLNVSAGATTFPLDANGTGGTNWSYSYVELKAA